jgi:hypothetical protein
MFVLRFVYGLVEHMLGVYRLVNHLFELLVTVAPVGHFLPLGAFLMFASCFVMVVVRILAGPRWVLAHVKDVSRVSVP